MTTPTATAHDLTLERLPVAELHTYRRNPRRGDVAAIRASLEANGQYRPLVVNRGTHTGRPAEVLAGNHTLLAARDAGWGDIAVCWVDVDDERAARIVAADNRTADLGGYDTEDLAALLSELSDLGGLAGSGYTDDDLAAILAGLEDGPPPGPKPTLADRFLIPPFSVLNARSGWWRARKATWLATGIASQEGRDERLVFTATRTTPSYYDQKEAVEAQLGRKLSRKEFEDQHLQQSPSAGTSVFDPVLCEIVYRWFSPAGGLVLDPWAGGSVRGLVAALLGRRYTGIDLSADQVAANMAQAETVLGDAPGPDWRVGDCADVLPGLPAEADLILGCPPYFDLEVYSDDPRDLSTMDDAGFEAAYREQLRLAAGRLRPDRFAVLVVGAARNKHGILRDLRGLTVSAAADAGLALYNEAVLVTPVGSLRISAGRTFAGSRVLGRTHQDVLIFVKGDRKAAAAACGQVDTADLDAAVQAAAAEDDDAEPATLT